MNLFRHLSYVMVRHLKGVSTYFVVSDSQVPVLWRQSLQMPRMIMQHLGTWKTNRSVIQYLLTTTAGLKQQITEIIYEKLLDWTISKNPIAVRLNLLFVNACLLFCFRSICWPGPMLWQGSFTHKWHRTFALKDSPGSCHEFILTAKITLSAFVSLLSRSIGNWHFLTAKLSLWKSISVSPFPSQG